MIPAEEALVFAKDRRAPKRDAVKLTDEELVAFNSIDYSIEVAIHKQFNGEPMEMLIPASVALSPSVLNFLKEKYEEGRWTVGIFPSIVGDNVVSFRLVLVPKEVAVAPEKQVLPPIVSIMKIPVQRSYARLLVRMPTRGRPEKALVAISRYRSMAGIAIDIEVVLDVDDETATPEFLYRLNQLDCVVTFGTHKSKIQACNGGKRDEWDILVLGSDDMLPVRDGWARRICELYEEHWPFFDGCLHLNDGAVGDQCCTLSVLGRRYYDRVGYVYSPSYKSLFCDNEHTEVARAWGRLTYVDEILIEHQHPAWGKTSVDPLYLRNDALYQRDKETYEQRREKNFYMYPVWLSVLICTYPERRARFEKLLNFLYAQMSIYYMQQVEIVIDDKPATSLGEKRQRLLERAKGRYVCFVDDDDWVAPDYVVRIMASLKAALDADCASLAGTMLTNGERPERFEHSLKHDKWIRREDGTHVRMPNHLSPVRTDLARQAGFGALSHGEDKQYSEALLPLLKKEAYTGEEPLYFYFYERK